MVDKPEIEEQIRGHKLRVCSASPLCGWQEETYASSPTGHLNFKYKPIPQRLFN